MTETKATKKTKKTKATKKVPKKVIEKVAEEATKTRAYQQRFDDKFDIMMYKYNSFVCEECGYNIHVNHSNIYTDPRTGRKFLGLRKVCSSSCENNDVLYELTLVTKDEIKKENINTFDIRN